MTNQNSRAFGQAALPVRQGKEEIDVWGLLCWAFGREHASLDRAEERTGLEGGVNVDPIYRMIEIAQLGCRVQGGGRSASHHDADIVAGVVCVLPEGLGGFRMATWIASLARSGKHPSYSSDAEVVPVDTKTNQHGRYAIVSDAKELGREGWPHQPRRNRKGRIVHDPVFFCPVLIRPTPDQIARDRRAYLGWHDALFDIRTTLQSIELTSFILNDRLPPRQPWSKVA